MQNFKPYLDFVRYAVGSLAEVPADSESIDWQDFFLFCQRQGIAGLVFGALEQSGLRVPQPVLFQWVGIAETIRATNRLLDKRCQQVSQFWQEHGYRSCILKGQANAMMHPRPELRSPGDIDIWVDGDTVELIKIAQKEAPQGHYSLHHVTMPVYDDTSVEVHYRPVFLDNWWLDRRLQRITDEVKDAQFQNDVTLHEGQAIVHALTDEFNALFLLLHMWHHLLSTRNNLKQLTDYYFLLRRGLTEEQRNRVSGQFSRLGVQKYARGIMWIEHKVLGLEEQYLITEPDEKIGRILLRETLHYGENKRRKVSKVHTLVSRITRNLHLFWYFPAPVLIAPAYLVWHQWWKWRMDKRLH